MPLNRSFMGMPLGNANFQANNDHYVRARDIGNKIPVFSGTNEHCPFEEFETMVRHLQPRIPTGRDVIDEYLQAILDRILPPAIRCLAHTPIETVDQILDILAEEYSVTKDLSHYIFQIQNAQMYKDESLEDFLRRLAVLVEYGLKTALKQFNLDGPGINQQEKSLHFLAIQRCMEYAPSITRESFVEKEIGTIEAALMELKKTAVSRRPPLAPISRIDRPPEFPSTSRQTYRHSRYDDYYRKPNYGTNSGSTPGVSHSPSRANPAYQQQGASGYSFSPNYSYHNTQYQGVPTAPVLVTEAKPNPAPPDEVKEYIKILAQELGVQLGKILIEGRSSSNQRTSSPGKGTSTNNPSRSSSKDRGVSSNANSSSSGKQSPSTGTLNGNPARPNGAKTSGSSPRHSLSSGVPHNQH